VVVIVQLLILITLHMIVVDPNKIKAKNGGRTWNKSHGCCMHFGMKYVKRVSRACKKFRAIMDIEENIVRK